MKLGFLFMLFGTATLLYLSYSTIFNPPDMVSIGGSMNAMKLTMLRRKLKENVDPPTPCEEKYYTDDVILQDYRPLDPIPSSTYSLNPHPIEHGTPLMPYVLGPSPPPEQEKHGHFP